VFALGLGPDAPTSFNHLEAMPLTEMAFKEALRIKPPVPSMPRRAIRDFVFMDYTIPGGRHDRVSIRCSRTTSRRYGPIPTRSTRCASPRRRNATVIASPGVPFGGGAHMCIGLHFAYMQAKCFARHFLQNLSVSLERGYKAEWQMWPIPKPRDGLEGERQAGVSAFVRARLVMPGLAPGIHVLG